MKYILNKSTLITVIIIILIIALHYFNPLFFDTLFYVKQVTIYVLITSLIVYWIIMLRKKIFIKKRIQKFIVINIPVVCLLIAGLHILYIKHYELPPLYGCSYYDANYNLIYNSQYEGSCPELENVVINKEGSIKTLQFTVNEEVPNNSTKSEKSFLKSNIAYTYDELDRVTDYEIQIYKKLHEKELELIYSKTINNVYDDQKLTSTHQVNNVVFSYDSTKEYISEYEKIETDPRLAEIVINSYQISIKERNDEDYQELYNITYHYNGNHPLVSNYDSFGVDRLSDLGSIIISHGKQNHQRMYHTDGKVFDEVIFINSYFYEKQSVNDSELFLYGFHKKRAVDTIHSTIDSQEYINTFHKKVYGLKIKHYSLKRNSIGMYQRNDFNENSYSGFIVNYNELSINIRDINDYEKVLNKVNQYPGFIYQYNPLIFEKYMPNLTQ